jgi:hypothetical protein
VKSSCEFGIESSGSIKMLGLSSALTTGGLSNGAQLQRVKSLLALSCDFKCLSSLGLLAILFTLE